MPSRVPSLWSLLVTNYSMTGKWIFHHSPSWLVDPQQNTELVQGLKCINHIMTFILETNFKSWELQGTDPRKGGREPFFFFPLFLLFGCLREREREEGGLENHFRSRTDKEKSSNWPCATNMYICIIHVTLQRVMIDVTWTQPCMCVLSRHINTYINK